MTDVFDDRQYVSQFATDLTGIQLYMNGVLSDADANTVMVSMVSETTSTTLFTRPANHASTGTYNFNFNSADTSIPDAYILNWSYVLNGNNQFNQTAIEVGPANPHYDYLSQDMKHVIENVYYRISDQLDSPDGRPNLTTFIQSKFGRGRMAQLLDTAMGRLNTMAQPYSTYSINDASFPMAQWGPFLETALWIETLKHLRRSYVEQPEPSGGMIGTVSTLNRRDYLDRWGQILADEEAMFKSQLDVFKIAHMGLGRPGVLIAGGVYGRYGPTRMAGSVAARPRYYGRFYS